MIDRAIETAIQRFTGMSPDQLKASIQGSVDGIQNRLNCLYLEIVRNRKANEAAFGRPPLGQYNKETGLFEDDSRFLPRNMATAPFWAEAEGEGHVATDPAKPLVIDLEVHMGRCPSSGFYANIGAEEFRVIGVYADGTRTQAHLVTPGTSIPITGFISKLEIWNKVDGSTVLPARYQVKAE